MGTALVFQLGTMRSPLGMLRSAWDRRFSPLLWLARLAVTVCPARKLLPSNSWTLIQPSCQA